MTPDIRKVIPSKADGTAADQAKSTVQGAVADAAAGDTGTGTEMAYLRKLRDLLVAIRDGTALPTGAATEATLDRAADRLDLELPLIADDVNRIPTSPRREDGHGSTIAARSWGNVTVVQADGTVLKGQQLAAESLPVVLTAAQMTALTTAGGLTDAQLRASAVPVSGPVTDAELRATALPVSTGLAQPLTDTQLRATAVPVSGPLTDAQLRASAVPVSGPLTDAQLRATPVPVSGTVTTGGLTDAQLRATPVPISGSVTSNDPGLPDTLGQKASAASTGVVLSTEQELLLDRLPTGVELLVNANLFEDVAGNSVPDQWSTTATSPAYVAAEHAWQGTMAAAGSLLGQSAQVASAERLFFAFRGIRTSGTGGAFARLTFFDSSSVQIGSPVDGFTGASLTYSTFSVAALAPSNAAYVTVEVRTSAASTWRIQRCTLMEVHGPREGQLPDALDANGGLKVNEQGLGVADFGQLDVPVTEVAIPVTVGSKTVAIKALKANSDLVYVAKTGVLTTTGWELDAGESIEIDVRDAVALFTIAASGTQRICYAKVA